MTISKKADISESQKPSGWLGRLSGKLSVTRENLQRGLGDLFLGKHAIDADLLEELEALLLRADVGFDATSVILEKIRLRINRHEFADAAAVYQALRTILLDMLTPNTQALSLASTRRPFVLMVIGVNGAGKTTTIGKLAHKYKAQGQEVMLAAGDTFRAAAVEQLAVWAERIQVPIIRQDTGADAASVIHDALQAAKARASDILIVDTAGRLHTQTGLMDELKKIKRVISKTDLDAPHEVLLVLDAGNGQNALAQLTHFYAAIGVTGLCLTKLDGTAKGGILFAIAQKTRLPIRFIGVGEGLDDLREFNAHDFVDALLPKTL